MQRKEITLHQATSYFPHHLRFKHNPRYISQPQNQRHVATYNDRQYNIAHQSDDPE